MTRSHTSHAMNRKLFADLLVLAFLTLLHPAIAPRRQRPHIPDKIETVVYHHQPVDSVQLHELQYYLRTHTVIDEGYNLIAQYHTFLRRQADLASRAAPLKTTTRRIAAKDRLLPAVITAGGYWKAGHYRRGRVSGPVILLDRQQRVVRAVFVADSIVYATRTDSLGTYRGQMNALLEAHGQGTYDQTDGTHYDGLWQHDRRHGFGFESSPRHSVRAGQWKDDRFLGERLRYTAERIYGIDISRHQHEKGRKRYAAARAQGIHVGAYHFFSLKSSALDQAKYFVNHTLFRQGDFPPVLDVEPTESQIRKIGGTEVLLHRIRTFMDYVERRTHMRPILYVNQQFVNRHMQNAADIKQRYNVWIARYGEYKPDLKLVYWQLTPDGRVQGIHGPVDINVFNGYQGQYDDFVRTGFHK